MENISKNIPNRATRRYGQGEDGRVQRLWGGKLPEEFSEEDNLLFLADTDIQLNGKISQDTLTLLDQAGYTYQNGTIQRKSMRPERQPVADTVKDATEFVKGYAAKMEKQTEDNKNFLIEDNSIFPFEIRDGSHAALRYAYIGKNNDFKDITDAESGVEMNIVVAIYRDGSLNEYDQGIEERKFTLKGVDAINVFCSKLDRSVKDSIKDHPDIQPVVTVNYSEYDNYNPLVGDHMRLSLDRANSLFELIDIVAGREVNGKGSRVSFKTSADVMYVQNGKIGHFDLSRDFGKNSGSIIKQIEGYIDDRIKYLDRHPELPDGKNQLQQWETAKKELIPFFNRHISLSRAERDLEYMGKAAAVMQDNIFEMRAFLNTGEIVPAQEKTLAAQDKKESQEEFIEKESMKIPERQDTSASQEQPENQGQSVRAGSGLASQEQSEDQSQPVKEAARNDKLQETMEHLEKGIKGLFDSERYKNYLNVMSKFHNYSVNNTILIAMQRPDATRVAGYNDWKNKFNRQVQKGEKGITIIQPVPYQIKRQVEKVDPQTKKVVIGADGKPVTEEVDVTVMKYKTGNVFDISQTDGPELPTIGVTELTGNVKEYPLFLRAVEQVSPVPVNFEQITDSSKGFYHQADKRIAVKEGMGELQSIKTLIHEIAHAKLHDRDLQEENDIDKRTKEVQAESIAYTVCQHFGLDTSDYSFAYLTGWSSGRELPELKASLETIRSTASELIEDIERNFAELTAEPTVTITESQHYHFHKGETMGLSEANALMESLDIDALANFERDISFKTMYRIDFVKDGKPDHFQRQQYLGDGNGTLVDNIESMEVPETDRTFLNEFVPYLKLHCNLSEMERISKEALQNRDNLTPAEIAYHTAMQAHVTACRGLVNQGENNLPPAPQLADFDMELQDNTLSALEEKAGVGEQAASESKTIQEVVEPAKEEMRPERSEEENRPDRVYLELPPVKKEEFTILLQELRKNGAKFDGEQKQWYTDKGSADSGIFNAYIRTYLMIPSMNKEKFASTVQQLRQDGAQFDQIHKKWYIDANCDKSKFQAYLLQKPKERPSALGKLQSAKKRQQGQGFPDSAKDIKQHQYENVI